jgi:hypothetical protein
LTERKENVVRILLIDFSTGGQIAKTLKNVLMGMFENVEVWAAAGLAEAKTCANEMGTAFPSIVVMDWPIKYYFEDALESAEADCSRYVWGLEPRIRRKLQYLIFFAQPSREEVRQIVEAHRPGHSEQMPDCDYVHKAEAGAVTQVLHSVAQCLELLQSQAKTA